LQPRGAARRAEWASLEARVGEALGCLEDGHFLILQTRDEEPYYVQFAEDGDGGMRVEAVSNGFLHGWRRLDSTAKGRLRRLGWRPPTDIGDGPANWWQPFSSPVPTERVAALAVATLTKAFDVARVSALTYRAFSRSGEEILLPTLGLDRLTGASEDRSLADRVDGALKEYLGLDEITRDRDGDAPIRTGEAMVFVRVLPERNYVAVFSPILRDLTRTAGLLAAVNEVNNKIRVARAYASERGVILAAEVDDVPGAEASVIKAFRAVSGLANSCAADLQSRFGGRTFFQESETDAGEHFGLYL
jgi:hypothetical protein